MGQDGKDSETFGNVMVIRCLFVKTTNAVFCSLRAIFYIGKIKHAQAARLRVWL
jgi:hypothetical protein